MKRTTKQAVCYGMAGVIGSLFLVACDRTESSQKSTETTVTKTPEGTKKTTETTEKKVETNPK